MLLGFLMVQMMPDHRASCLRTRKEGNMLMDIKEMNSILEMVATSRKLIENTVRLVSSHLISGTIRYCSQLKLMATLFENTPAGVLQDDTICSAFSDTACIIGMVRHCAPSMMCRPNPEFISESGFSSYLCITRALPCQTGSSLNFVS